MKMRFRSPNGQIEFEMEVSGPDKSAFEQLAAVQEVFGESNCGCCNSVAIYFDTREFDGHKYFKMVCKDCRAQLDFGQNKDGHSLFPKRYDSEAKKPLPNRGWYIWSGDRRGEIAGNGKSNTQKWTEFLASTPPVNVLNEWCRRELAPIGDESERRAIWDLIKKHAASVGFRFDGTRKEFVTS